MEMPKMGRPIQKKWFGLPITAGSRHIVVNGIKFADGTTASNGYIVRQVGHTAYIVQDAAKAHAAEICFMVNATSTGALLPGQCYILATPFGGSALPCEKIQQFRLSVYNNGTTTNISNYAWSTLPAVMVGQADLLVLSPPVNTVLPLISGTAQVGQTLSTTTGTWTGTTPITYTYQWKRAGVPITGAYASTYIAVTADIGSALTVTVTATSADGSASATSLPTAAVIA